MDIIKPVATKLDLCEQQLTTIPPEIFESTDLTELYLDNNQLTELPAEITQLKQLERLYLANNKFIEIPTEIIQLPNLEVISFVNNKIKVIPETVTNLPKLKTISLYKNPLIFPPQEIAIKGSQETLTFLRAEKQPKWTAKLILVGNARAGKTTLLKALKKDTVDTDEKPTHGIAVGNWSLEHPTKDVTMQLKTWDFGGQTIQQLTHQFFLTDQALFVLVWDSSVGYKNGKVRYWLENIQAKAPNSLILLVATHIDEGFNAKLPFKDFKRKYPQIIGHYEVDSLSGKNIDTVLKDISETVTQLP
ncbi:leucine-rich repeat domain-containing protein [Candidatus Halobeggiatoa sp. HSG11]|nr:leucine-rich repeat domain-containing protein [Candidatus Halobeggiatoa sp. HSG11]